MAIVNLTPDSFYDGGKYDTLDEVYYDVEEKIKQGADVIDLGAASSRPNATEISEEAEWARLEKPLAGLRKRFPDVLISVDTYRASIAGRSCGEGANMINDIGGGKLDANMMQTIASLDIPYVMMHIQGTPQTMQKNPTYENVTTEVMSELREKIEILKALNFDQIILDPGFGFGKTVSHNFQLLKNLRQFTEFQLPVLVGVSRKGMINQVLGTSPVTALNGSTVLNTLALHNGASILRVHDVTEARQAVQLMEFYKNC